ncbi:multiprotein bridging factor aMBF1 [Halorubrum ezzemoulense]|uniref:multiprotein bridging factor aMBF1 n=1 Tax=Halorubrum ezzemoulense TaxID=337243 RepID=UPI000BBBAAE9|nr:multiprotein bridging factor aMBF1 [Halorubrum ezzemoulense]
MPQCEMCGAEEASLTTTKVEGAELELCSSCTDFGTEVRDESTSSGGGKYSTSSSTGKSSSSSGSSGSGGSSGSPTRPRDMFDDMDEIATDYDELIRDARESRGLSQEELADQLNEKASLIRKLERADTLPTDEVQRKLERAPDISLVEGQSTDDADWETDDAGTMTLGDVVKRKD